MGHSTWLALLVLPLAAAAQDPADWVRPGENVALGKPYTYTPRTNYSYTTDPGDATQLTDGEYTEGYFWTTPTTVGWSGVNRIVIRIDLGADEPLCGFSYHTAAGRADVTWPSAIHAFVSDDGEGWWYAGELLHVAIDQHGPPPEEFAVHRFWTDRLQFHGRHIALVIVPSGAYTFCDEIELYRGDPALLATPRRGAPADLDTAILRLWFRDEVVAELASLREQATGLAEAARTEVATRLEQVEAGLDEVGGAAGERATVPFGDTQRKLFLAQAALWRALGVPGLVLWSCGRYDPLAVTAPPPTDPTPPQINLAMMRNEVRGEAFCLSNATDEDRTLVLAAADVPGAPRPPWLQVYEVAWTGTRHSGAVAAALPDALPVADGWAISVPAGMTRQVWLNVASADLAPGTVRGVLRLSEGGQEVGRVPLEVRVSTLTMPDELTLACGGWDYTDRPTYDISAENLDQVVDFLRRYHVNAPWASAAVMPFGRYDADGVMVEAPNTTAMDTWLDRWPGARYYCVFAAVSQDLPATPSGRRQVEEWIDFWVAHLGERGIGPEQLVLLLVDEPYTKERDDLTISWARAIREAHPAVQLFVDPIWQNPGDIDPLVLELCTILSPNRALWLAKRAEYEQVYLPRREPGRQLAFYSCSGPVRALDPYAYHRLQGWECWRYGGIMTSFWAFSDSGGGSSWNEYEIRRTAFCPQYLGPDGATTSKHMEAVLESLFDYEYFAMLRAKVAAAGPGDNPALRRARELLETGPARVLDAAGADQLHWAAPKDRSLADAVRLEVLAALEALE